MHYTLHQLRIFTKVYENKSITKTSAELFLTQPAISIQLKKLQDEFEIPLTEVIGRQLYITDFGEEIYKHAKAILEMTEDIQSVKDQFKGKVAGKINIASASTGKYVIPYFLADFMKLYPEIRIKIDVTNKAKVVESLQENSIDFAMVSVVPPTLSLEYIPLTSNELYLVSAANYENLPKKMTSKQLSKHTLILRENGSATRNAMEAFLNKNQITITRSMELVSNEAVKQAVRAGLGLSIMPIIGIRSELQLENMKIIPIQGLPIVTQWNLAYSSGKKLSPACGALVEYLNEHKEEISKRHFGA